jgi:hypothetical protein
MAIRDSPAAPQRVSADIAPICCCTAQSGLALHMRKIATELIGQWSSE